jgi:hypothetical protein
MNNTQNHIKFLALITSIDRPDYLNELINPIEVL